MTSTTLSVSKVRAWNTCRLMWWITYVLKPEKPTETPAHLTRGTILHECVAAAYLAARDWEITQTVQVSRLGATMRTFEEQALTVLDGFGLTGIERIEIEGALLTLLDALRMPAPAAIVAVETPFEMRIGTWVIRGSIDLGLRTGARSVHIRDWKWSELPDVDSQQSATYNLAARTLFPWADKITVGYYSIKRNEETSGELSDEVLNYRTELLDFAGWEQVDALEAASRPGARLDQLFPATKGDHCGSCLFRAYCPEFPTLDPSDRLIISPDALLAGRAAVSRKLSLS